MSLKRNIFNHIATISSFIIIGSLLLLVHPILAQTDSLKYPINDTNSYSSSDDGEYNPFDLTPSNLDQKVEYDPKTGQYVMSETIGGITYQRPTTLSFIDYWKNRDRQVINNYWSQKSNSQNLLQGKGKTPPLFQNDISLSGPFGSNKVDIRPTGNIDLVFGFQNQTVENPTLPLRAQNPGPTFLFDMGIDMGVTGNIGEKLRLETKYNTKSVFDFDNQIKLEYIGDEDEIIQEIRAGNVNFNLPVTLIPGAQNLFGIQTKLKFGRLTVNTVLSQQRSKAKNITLQNGGQIKEFEVSSYEYDDNRHFFLAQYFRNNFEEWVSTRPYIQSPINITRLDVYVSDNRGTPEDTQRDITALADLGEITPFNPNTTVSSSQATSELPRNEINSLQRILATGENNTARNLGQAITSLERQYQLQDVRDFRQTRARRLNESEYTFDPQLGFVSVNFRLNPNEVIGVAYEYVDARTGDKHQVGEFAEDIFPVDSLQTPKIAFLKMLKSTSLVPSHPIFELMMKNVYSLGTFQLEQQDFNLNIYYENAGGGELRYLPEGESLKGQPLLQVLGLDQLNAVNQPQSDGIFDFLPAAQNNSTRATGSNSSGGGGGRGGRGGSFGGSSNATASATNAYRYGTINVRNGRIIFPLLEPFGSGLKDKFTEAEEELASKYTYEVIYDSTKTIALEYPEKNRFWIRGTYKETVSSEIPLGAFNIPPGSVRVTAGGRVLTEGSDYSVDYNLGRVRILNDAYLQAGIPINVSFEDSGIFGLQQKTYIGARLDYQLSKDINFGGTFVRLSERPFTQKINYGEDPIANSMVGLDMNYFTEAPWITRMVDKLPFLDTKEPSSITFNAEVAGLLPGHSRAIDGGSNGTAYIDDFEGSNNTFDLRFPYNAWQLASTPKGATDEFGTPLFQEASLSDDLTYNFNRAKLAWYQIDFFFSPNSSGLTNSLRAEADTNHYARLIPQLEIFPNLQSNIISNTQANTVTFDMAYYPDERGQYNYETEGSSYSAGLDENGKLKDPESRWGGIMRNCPYKDFEAANVEFVEFWLMDPLIHNPDNDGYLYLNLGNVSEDVLKDGRAFYENSLNETVNLDSTTVWGVAPRIPPLINGFSNEIDIRQAQDIGFDGLSSANETEEFQEYINYVQGLRNAATNPDARTRLDEILADPSGDDFRFFRDGGYDLTNASILERYKAYNGAEGNSPVQTDSINFRNSATNLPETEDLDNDRSLERSEAYLQYRIHLKRFQDMQIGEDYLADHIDARVDFEGDRRDTTVRWYYFRVPVDNFTDKVGSVDLRNIEGIRMFMTGFEDPIVCRFARFNLVRSNWRRYDPVLREEGEYLPNDNETDSYFNISTVSLEQNSDRSAIPYIIPPGIQRENITNAQFNVLQNEQAISVEVGRLKDGEARAIYKTIDMDMRVFKNLEMFIHTKSDTSRGCFPIEDDEVTAFIRLGDDFQQNYYEYEVPLKVTQAKGDTATYGQRDIWPLENDINVPLQELVKLKLERNSQRRANPNLPVNKPFIQYIDADSLDLGKRRRRVSVVGSPDLGRVKQVMLGVRNPKRTSLTERDAIPDDGTSVCATVWFNELRLTDFDEGAGFAGVARMDIKLADFGSMTLSGNAHTNGFGQIEQRVHERLRDNYVEYNASTNLELGRLLPQKSGVRIPMYAGITRTVSTPEYDPYDTDVIFEEQIDSIRAVEERINPNEANDIVKEERKKRQTATTIKSLNFTNVRKERTNPERKPKIWDVENLDLTYAYTKTESRDPIIKSDDETRHFGALAYKYNTRPKNIYPFKKMIKSKSKYLSLIKDFNINLIPNKVGFQTDIERYKQKVQLRKLGAEDFDPNAIWNKYIFWNRRYNFDYQPTKSINFTFNANNQSVIDELAGDPSNAANKERLRQGFKDLGRTTLYDQSASLSYNLPMNKIPFLDWTTIRTSYGSTYKWQGNPVSSFDNPSSTGIASEIGNNIYNSQDIQLNAELSFSKLYNKIPLFKKATSNRSNRKKPRSRKPKDKKADTPDAGKKDKRAAGEISPVAKILLQPLLMLKRVSLNYNDRKSTVVPGFNYESQYIGQNWDVNAPGFGFIFGQQPDDPWLERAAENEWLTKSDRLYDPVIRSIDKSFRLTTRLEPFKDLRVDVNMNLNYNKTNREFFTASDITDKNTRAYEHLPLQNEGGYSISYIAFNTLYDDIDTSNISSTFKRFEGYRSDISRRWQGINSNSQGDFEQNGETNVDYAFGYGPVSPDVLAPAFVAAYTGKDPETMNLNILNHFPLPNWRVSYNGLNKLPLFKALFSSINISHAYNSNLNINNFRQDLDFTVDRRNPDVTNDGRLVDYIVGESIAIPTTIDTITGNYFTHYIVPNISISEQFAPMFGIDATWINGLSTRFEYKTARSLGMSFIDYQLSEQRSEEFVIGVGYTFQNGFKVPFKWGGKEINLENELSFKFDLSIRDDYTVNHSLDQDLVQDVRGMKTIRISPVIDYVLSERLRASIFYDYTRTIPRTSQSFPVTNQQGGLRINFTLN